MRGGRSLLVLVVLALGLGAYIYFVESKKDVDSATKKDKVFTVESGKIDDIEVHSATGDITHVKKNGNDWQVVAPLTTNADQGAVGSIASNLESLEVQKSLDDNPKSVTEFGLDPARFSVAFKVGGVEHKLNVGNKTPTGSDLYARVDGQPKLFLIASFTEDAFNRSTFDLRDKTALTFARDNVDAISLEADGAPAVSVTKKDSDWRLTKPVEARADFTSVDSLLTRLAQAQMKSIVADEANPPSAKDLKTYGLDKPQLTVTIGAGSTRATLAIGGKKDDATVYARDMSKPLVFAVETGLLTDLKKKPDDLRIKDVFEFKAFSATGLDIVYGGATYSFANAKPAGGDAAAATTWKETKPAAKDVNQTGMTDFLNTLSSLKADSFTDHPLASGDDMVVVARSGDTGATSEEHVTLRKSGAVVQAIRAGEAGAAVVPSADFDKALTQFKELTGTK